jgi:hypothetical protein
MEFFKWLKIMVRYGLNCEIYRREGYINPSAYGDLIPSSYCDVRRFPAGYLNLELNFAGVYAN